MVNMKASEARKLAEVYSSINVQRDVENVLRIEIDHNVKEGRMSVTCNVYVEHDVDQILNIFKNEGYDIDCQNNENTLGKKYVYNIRW